METIRGRKSHQLDSYEFSERVAYYNRILLDLGTGDGRYVRTLARQHPDWFVIGVDACRENLREHSQAKLQNILFVIASAQQLPREFDGLVTHIAINFPWGSLLEGLLATNSNLTCAIKSVARPKASLRLRLNSGALAEAGKTLEAGTDRISYNLVKTGWQIEHPVVMDAGALKKFPSTWAKRLAFGRDPRAMMISGRQ